MQETMATVMGIDVDDISKLGRITSGVKLMNLDSEKDIRIASIARVREDETSDGEKLTTEDDSEPDSSVEGDSGDENN